MNNRVGRGYFPPRPPPPPFPLPPPVESKPKKEDVSGAQEIINKETKASQKCLIFMIFIFYKSTIF